MKIRFKIPSALLTNIRDDLARQHPFAHERVGFISCRVGALENHGLVVLAHIYHPVADYDYQDDPRFGAMMASSALRKALEFAYNNAAAMFHVHKHEHSGKPRFSSIDLREYAKFIPDFWKVQPTLPHGAIVLSNDKASGLTWYPGSFKPLPIKEIWAVGPRMLRL